MAIPVTAAAQIKEAAAKNARQETAEDKLESQAEVQAGFSRVRLIRPLHRKGEKMLLAGIHTIPSDEVPSSAKVLASGDAPVKAEKK